MNANSEPPPAQTSTKKREKLEPVQLVNQFILIIKILANGPKGKNEICREIEAYKKLGIPQLVRRPNIYSAINYLDKGKIINKKKIIKQAKNKKYRKYAPYELTDFGKELSKLINDIDLFVITYTNFRKQYKEKFPLLSANMTERKNKYLLEQIGWKKDEIKKYFLYLNETFE